MKITRIRIDKYGPLSNLDLPINERFQCIYGPNESGKTLLVDALLKSAFGKRVRSQLPRGVDRVPDRPKGWLSVLLDSRKEITAENMNLAEVLGIEPEECKRHIRGAKLRFGDVR